jgi:hypothetical protein
MFLIKAGMSEPATDKTESFRFSLNPEFANQTKNT